MRLKRINYENVTRRRGIAFIVYHSTAFSLGYAENLHTLVIREDAAAAGFPAVYLCTDHVGYYEKYGFRHVGTGYHPWGDESRIYEALTAPAE